MSKHKTKYLKYNTVLTLIFSLFLTACSKDPHSSSWKSSSWDSNYYFQFLDVTSVSPREGSPLGNDLIKVYGRHFQAGSQIKIGGIECSSPTFINSSELTCISGPRSTGYAHVTVTRPDQKTATLYYGFKYANPNPTLQRAEPNHGPQGEATRVTIAGNHFVTGIEVYIGWLLCTQVIVHSPTSLSCSTHARHYPGITSIMVRNPEGSSITLESAFTYDSVPATPPNHNRQRHETVHQTPGRPAPAATASTLNQRPPVANLAPLARPSVPDHGHFPESEAQILKSFFHTRTTGGNFLNSVTINNREIDISNSSAPEQLLRAYTIQSSDLAHHITNSGAGIHIEANSRISQAQVDTLPEAIQEEIIDAIGNGVSVENNVFPNPVFHARPTSTEQTHYLEYLRAEVKRQITNLNNNSEHRFTVPATRERPSFSYYINPLHLHGMIIGGTQSLAEAFDINLNTYEGRTNAYLWPRVHENQYDRETLEHLMDAIEHNNEHNFISNLVSFATSFDSETTGPKSAFIDAFTFLYVTKNFPSEALRQLYFHFILRCGQIH